WRAKFGDKAKLLALSSSSKAAEIAQPCTTEAEFKSRVNSLADVLDSLRVDDGLLTDPKTKGAVKRVEEALRRGLTAESYSRVEAPAGVLRDIVRFRVGLTHSGAGNEAHERAYKLGLEWPTSNWGPTWEQIRNLAAAAVREIRQAIEADLATQGDQ